LALLACFSALWVRALAGASATLVSKTASAIFVFIIVNTLPVIMLGEMAYARMGARGSASD
jgi:hypothetical protein